MRVWILVVSLVDLLFIRASELKPKACETDTASLRCFVDLGDQTFDISVEKDLWLMATVRDRSLVGKHDDIGRAYVRLDPRRYADFLTHEVWYDLEEKTGRLLLRISMEGEKDEIGFYFGRAFRSLKRAETDMIRIFVDKVSISPFKL
jgi:hypothetical protein